MNKQKRKEMILIISSFFLGGIVMYYLSIIPLFRKDITNNYQRKNDTKVYENATLKEAINKVYDSVVLIENVDETSSDSIGTGFIYRVDNKEAYILTNEHVITNEKEVKLTFTNNENEIAKVLGKDEYLDLTVLKIKKSKVLLAATFGNSKDSNIGDTILTIGSPIGYEYRGTVTSGIISGKNRLVSTSLSTTKEDYIMDAIQIDAPINPGNSGGPLVNINGEVIGICTMKLVDSNIEGMGFAIPIEIAQKHLEKLEKNEKIERPSIEATTVNIDDFNILDKNKKKIDKNIKNGVVIIDIKEKGISDKAGLKKGDIIKKIDNIEIKNKSYFNYYLFKHQKNDNIKITYIREGKDKDTIINL